MNSTPHSNNHEELLNKIKENYLLFFELPVTLQKKPDNILLFFKSLNTYMNKNSQNMDEFNYEKRVEFKKQLKPIEKYLIKNKELCQKIIKLEPVNYNLLPNSIQNNFEHILSFITHYKNQTGDNFPFYLGTLIAALSKNTLKIIFQAEKETGKQWINNSEKIVQYIISKHEKEDINSHLVDIDGTPVEQLPSINKIKL